MIDQSKPLPAFETRGDRYTLLIESVDNMPSNGFETDDATESDLTALLSAMPAEQRARILATAVATLDAENLAVVMRATSEVTIDEATDLESQRILDMSDEEVLAEFQHPERAERWGQANARWLRFVCEFKARAESAEAKLAMLESDRRCGECGAEWVKGSSIDFASEWHQKAKAAEAKLAEVTLDLARQESLAHGYADEIAQLQAERDALRATVARLEGEFKATRRSERLALLGEIYQRLGQLVPESYADKQGQHVGIASCREVVTQMLAPLVKS